MKLPWILLCFLFPLPGTSGQQGGNTLWLPKTLHSLTGCTSRSNVAGSRDRARAFPQPNDEDGAHLSSITSTSERRGQAAERE